jgi:hypothetical protein
MEPPLDVTACAAPTDAVSKMLRCSSASADRSGVRLAQISLTLLKTTSYDVIFESRSLMTSSTCFM